MGPSPSNLLKLATEAYIGALLASLALLISSLAPSSANSRISSSGQL